MEQFWNYENRNEGVWLNGYDYAISISLSLENMIHPLTHHAVIHSTLLTKKG